MGDTAYREKLESLGLGRDRVRRETKTTTDVHDGHTVDVVEHFHDRQDVKIRLGATPVGRLSDSPGLARFVPPEVTRGRAD